MPAYRYFDILSYFNVFLFFDIQEDIFSIEAADLGYVRKVTIRHDNSNLGSDWYLDRVEIEAVAEGRRFVFPCERWLAKKKDDGKIKRTIYEKSYTVSITFSLLFFDLPCFFSIVFDFTVLPN